MENKISKICYNQKNWTKPSGSYGKSPDPKSYETKSGFGHEEWLFDKSKIINGYHYGFLQSLNLKGDKHVNKNYNIYVYTSYQRKKYLVGNIKKAICISKDKSSEIFHIYKKNGWLKEMSEQLKIAGINDKSFLNTQPMIFFNNKFKFKDVEYYKPFKEISDNDKNILTTRYKLLEKKFEFIFENTDDTSDEDYKEGKIKSTNKRRKHISCDIEYDPYHDKIQKSLKEILKKEYPTVLYESSRVDLKAKTKSNEWHYYEIKTDSPKISIRNALGQLMEYCYYPNTNKAKRLFIISDRAPDNETVVYLENIRKKFGLPIYYRFFDIEKKYLSKEY